MRPLITFYFPDRGVLSAMNIMRAGDAIEVATIGNEGMVGIMAVVGADISPNEIMVQVAGDGFRMKAAIFNNEAGSRMVRCGDCCCSILPPSRCSYRTRWHAMGCTRCNSVAAAGCTDDAGPGAIGCTSAHT